MRQPHVRPEPAQLVGVLDGGAAELGAALLLLVGGLREVGVQPNLVAARQFRGLTHEIGADGERCARADRDAHPRAGFRVVEAVDRVLSAGQRRVEVFDDGIRWQPAVQAAPVHRTAYRMQPHADPLGRGDHRAENVAAGPGKDVVVVGGRGAAGQRHPGQARRRGGVCDLRVNARPDRVQLGQPVEQRRVRRVAASGPLVEVVVGVDQPRGDQAAGRIDAPHRALLGRGGTGADRHDALTLDDDVALAELGARVVDRDHGAALDDGPAHACAFRSVAFRWAASRTASMIFS